MKIKLYVRVAQGRKTAKAAAGVRPSYQPLTDRRDGVDVDLPTAMFALDLEIPAEALKRAEQVAASVALDAAAGQVIVRPLEPIG